MLIPIENVYVQNRKVKFMYIRHVDTQTFRKVSFLQLHLLKPHDFGGINDSVFVFIPHLY